MEKPGQALGVELIGLVEVAHHDLGLGSVSQKGEAAGGFNLTGDPHRPGVLPGVPIADALQGHRRAFGEPLQESLDSAGLVIDPALLPELAILVQDGKLRVVLVGVATHSIIRHGCTSFTCALSRHECSGRCSAFI